MDVRSKLKLFNNEVLVYSGSCTTEDGEVQQIFQRWEFPEGCGSTISCGYFASREWVEACVFFREIKACGFTYGNSSLTLCTNNVKIGACNCFNVTSKEAITLCADSKESDENPAYVQIGYYDSKGSGASKVEIYGDEISIRTGCDESSGLTINANDINLIGSVTAEDLTVGCTSVFTCDSTFGDNATVTFGCSPYLTNVNNFTEDQLVPKCYVDNAVANKNGFSYVDPDGNVTSSAYFENVSSGPPHSGIKFPGPNHYIVGTNGEMVITGGNLNIWGCCTLTLCSSLDTHINSFKNVTIHSGCEGCISLNSGVIELKGSVSANYLTVGCTSVFTCDSTFGNNAAVNFGCAPFLTNVNNLSETQLVPKSYVDNATAKKFSCTYTDTDEHTISIDTRGILFSPENASLKGCGDSLHIEGRSIVLGGTLPGSIGTSIGLRDTCIYFSGDSSASQFVFTNIPFVNTHHNHDLSLGCGERFFATEAYVNAKINQINYTEFEEGLKIGKGACVVEVSTSDDVVVFNETELPTTGGTVATQDYVEESIKSLPYTCIYNLGECTPVNGIASWEITLMCGDQLVKSIIPPHISILRNDPSTMLGGIYVNADVSVNIMDDVGIPSETRIKIEMNATETVPANTFKAVVSNIYARCF